MGSYLVARRNRDDMVAACILDGLTVQDMCRLKDGEGNKVFSGQKVVEASIDRVYQRWIQHDADWFIRYPKSRVLTDRRLEHQIREIKGYMKDPELEHYDRANYQRQLTHIYEVQHKIRCEIDPSDMISKVQEKKINLDKIPELKQA